MCRREPRREGSLVLQHDDIAGGSAGKQRPDQLRGHGLVALRTLVPLQAVGERVCVGATQSLLSAHDFGESLVAGLVNRGLADDLGGTVH